MIVLRRLVLISFAVALSTVLAATGPAAAHSGIQSYVYVSVFDDGLEGRVEYPIGDLGAVLGIDFPDDPDDALEVAESRSAEIIDYSDEHLDLSDGDGAWNLVFTGEVTYLDAAGGYLQVPFVVDEAFDEIPRSWTATYDGIIESNPERDALFLIEDDWDSATFRNEGEHLLGFSIGNETQEIVLDEVSSIESLAELARFGTNAIDESAIAILALIALLSSATLGRRRPDADRPTEPVLTTVGRVATWTAVVVAGQTISLWIIGLTGADVSERLAVLLAAIGVLVAAASRWLDDRAALISAGVTGLLIGVLVGFDFVDQLLDRSRPLRSLLAFSVGASAMIVIITAMLLPLALILTRVRWAPRIATVVSVVALIAGVVWAVERAADLTFKLRTAEFDAANAATSPIVIGAVTVIAALFVFTRADRSASSSDPSNHDPDVDDHDRGHAEPQKTEAP